jgi:hypothetical protein
MPGVFAYHADYASPFDNLALFADFLDAGSNLHGLPRLKFSGDLSTIGIVNGQSNNDAITGNQSSCRVSRSFGRSCPYRAAIYKAHGIQSKRQRVLDYSHDLT